MHKQLRIGILLLSCLGIASPAMAAVEVFLKLPDVNGEANDSPPPQAPNKVQAPNTGGLPMLVPAIQKVRDAAATPAPTGQKKHGGK